MSAKRFEILSAAMRFDDPETRVMRKLTDQAAAISFIFNQFIKNCKAPMSLSDSLCIDEMLVPFRGRCKFRIYMPKKPAKYGIKIQCLIDARNSYFYDEYIYTGKDSDGRGLSTEEKQLSIPTQSVIRLVSSVKNTGRNITTDNWYGSVELCRELTKRGLTLVSTLKKNKQAIPSEFQAFSRKPVLETKFGFTENMTLLSFVPKKNKNVIMISTMFHNKAVDTSTHKPEMIMFYNKTKGGVDGLDRKCSVFSSKKRSLRWPMTIFFRIVDIAGINSHLLFLYFRENPLVLRFRFVK